MARSKTVLTKNSKTEFAPTTFIQHELTAGCETSRAGLGLALKEE